MRFMARGNAADDLLAVASGNGLAPTQAVQRYAEGWLRVAMSDLRAIGEALPLWEPSLTTRRRAVLNPTPLQLERARPVQLDSPHRVRAHSGKWR